MSIVFGLSSACMFGLVDILIAHATRTIGIRYTQVLAQVTAAGVLGLFCIGSSAFWSQAFPLESLPLLLCIGCILGLVNSLTNLSLYRALALGPLSLISPITASYGLITMTLAVLFLHEIPSLPEGILLLLMVGGMILTISATAQKSTVVPCLAISRQMRIIVTLALGVSVATAAAICAMLSWLQVNGWVVLLCVLAEGLCMGLACSLAAGPALSLQHHRWSPQRQQHGFYFGFGAMCGFGIEYFLLSLATAHLGLVQPVVFSRLFSALFLVGYARHQHVTGWGDIPLKQFGFIMLIGLFDVLGTISYNIGSRESTLLVAALSSLYPLLPLLVGVLRYRERMKRLQWTGTGLMLLAMVGLSIIGK